MRFLFVGVLFLLLVGGSWVWAQGAGSGGGPGAPGDSGPGSPGAGSVSNDGPTPIGGFGLFDGSCLFGNEVQRLVVCEGTPCNVNPSNHICASSYSLLQSLSCAGPAPISKWGVNSGLGAACCKLGGSCTVLGTPDNWKVGVSSSSLIPNATLPVVEDARSVRAVRRSLSEWFVAPFVSGRAKLVRSTDSGLTWPGSFFIDSLIPSVSLPLNVSLSSVVVESPSLGVGQDGSLHLVFSARDSLSGGSAVYYASCPPTSACGSSSDWTASLVLDPLFDVDAVTGLWKYGFGSPKLVVGGSQVHLVFDDTHPESPARFDGIIYRSCDFSLGCDSFTDFFSIGASPDILNGLNGGYPRSPAVAIDSGGNLHVAYLDASGILYARALSSSTQWSPSSLVAGGFFARSPSLSAGDDHLLVVSGTDDSIRVFSCPDGLCTLPGSLPAWVDASSSFDALSSSLGWSGVVGLVSPSDGEKAIVVGSSLVSGVRRLVGVFHDADSSYSTGLRSLTDGNADVSFLGVSDLGGLFFNGNEVFASADFLLLRGSNAFLLSSDVLDFSNGSPQLSSLSPDSGVWTNGAITNPSGTDFLQVVDVDIVDSDAGDALYASVFLSSSSGGEEYPLLLHQQLTSPPLSSGVVCDSSVFTSPVSCALTVSLFSVSKGLAVPNGSYYLTVKVEDSAGGVGSLSSSQPIQVVASLSNLIVNKPLTSEVWHQKNPSQHVIDFVAQDATFAQSLGIKLTAVSASGSSVDLGLVDVASHDSTVGDCSLASADYSCDTIVAVPSDLPEGVYNLVLSITEDGISTSSKTVSSMTLDVQGPHFTDSSPSGTIPSFPSTISFSLSDFSGIDAGALIEVQVNGVDLDSSPDCTPSSGIVSSLSCTVDFDPDILSLQGESTFLDVVVSSFDGWGNEGS
ncbi:MAG: hypothetical protein AABW68_03205 [archaeon]